MTSVEVGCLLIDHHAVHCLLQAPKPDRKKKHVSYRKYAAIDTTKFRSELSHLITIPCNDVDDLSEEYDTSLKELLDRHAPLITRPITVRPNTPWHTIELLHAKRKLRQAERKWRLTKLQVHRDIYTDQRESYKQEIQSVKAKFYAKKLKNVHVTAKDYSK